MFTRERLSPGTKLVSRQCTAQCISACRAPIHGSVLSRPHGRGQGRVGDPQRRCRCVLQHRLQRAPVARPVCAVRERLRGGRGPFRPPIPRQRGFQVRRKRPHLHMSNNSAPQIFACEVTYSLSPCASAAWHAVSHHAPLHPAHATTCRCASKVLCQRAIMESLNSDSGRD